MVADAGIASGRNAQGEGQQFLGLGRQGAVRHGRPAQAAETLHHFRCPRSQGGQACCHALREVEKLLEGSVMCAST